MDKYFMWIHYERLHNHNKAKHNKTVCIFLGIYCNSWNWIVNVTTKDKYVWYSINEWCCIIKVSKEVKFLFLLNSSNISKGFVDQVYCKNVENVKMSNRYSCMDNLPTNLLNGWCRETHIFVSKSGILGPNNAGDNPLSEPVLDYCHFDTFQNKFQKIFIQILHFPVYKMHSKISPTKWQPLCRGLNELKEPWLLCIILHIHAHCEWWPFWWFSVRLQYLQCVSNGDTAVLHYAIDSYLLWC